MVGLRGAEREGLVRHLGASNLDAGQLRRMQASCPSRSCSRPTLWSPPEVGEELLPAVEQEGIGVIASSPMGSGLLAGRMTRERIAALPGNDWRRRHERFREPALSRHLETVERLKAVAERGTSS